jgi:glycosyltransferase involved in cell wall biosynthesis
VGETHGANGPLVTVVIPCYNQGHFLGEAIESVLSQSYPRYEVVVVDDGSTDDTSEVAGRYDGVRLIRQENKGVNAARNAGIEHSGGEYLVFLDADDRLLPEALAAGLECFASHPECAFVFGHSNVVATDGSLRAKPAPPPIGHNLVGVLLSRSYYVIPGEVLHRRSALEDVGLFDPSLNASEDYDLYFRIMRRYAVYCHAKIIHERRRHEGNTTRMSLWESAPNAEKMLRGTVMILRRQRSYAKRDKFLTPAYEAGLSRARKEYGVPLAREVRRRITRGEWGRAASGAWALLRYYPGGLALVWNGTRWLAWKFQARDERLRAHRRRMKELDSAVKKERNKVRRLGEQNRRSELRARELQQQLHQIQESKT